MITPAPAWVEVKISPEGLTNNMKILATLLRQLKDTRNQISYIDLRFKEPVIKLRDVKK